MTEENKHQEEELNEQVDTSLKEPTEEQLSEKNSSEEDNGQTEKSEKEKLAEAEEMIAKLKDQLLRQMAEFDNFRKRTLREKSELIKNAAESAFKGLLPIVDDFERALKATEGVSDAGAVREGMELIYKKLKKYMEQNGVREMDPEDRDFDADRHEAISAVPVPDESLKGKILDTVEKGYTINDKVLRHAKVVVGQ